MAVVAVLESGLPAGMEERIDGPSAEVLTCFPSLPWLSAGVVIAVDRRGRSSP